MQRVLILGRRQATLVNAAAVLMLAVSAMPMPAHALDLFARHEVTAQFTAQDGKPMADAEVSVFAPGNSGKPVTTGHTDADGKFTFPAETDGFWSAEARTGSEIARVSIRVGEVPKPDKPVSPILIFGVLGVLLVIAVWYRVLRARARRRTSR